MHTQRQKIIGCVVLLLCAQSLIGGKFCRAQVGFAWEPRCTTAVQQANLYTPAMGGGRIDDRVNQGNALNFDVFDANEVQRSVLFDYFNANREAVYSADGVSGWDTDCKMNPIAALRRDRQQRANVASPLGEGQYWVDPLPKRAYVPPTPNWESPQQASPQQSAPPMNLPQPQQREQPLAAPPTHNPLVTESDPLTTEGGSNPYDALPELNEELEWDAITTESEDERFPPPEEYEDATGDFEWDDSFLDELPELNRGARQGNPLPPSSTDLHEHGIIRRPANSLMTARPMRRPLVPLPNQVRSQVANPHAGSHNALEAAIQLEAANQRAASR